MHVLAIDTATAVTTVAVAAESTGVLADASHLDARHHAEILPRLVREVLDRAGIGPHRLGLIAVGVGPGPFTGLRVGVAFARATAHALGIPAVGVMSLDSIAYAHEAGSAGGLTVVTRSRRVEVAWATYAEGVQGLRRTAGPLIQPDPGFPRQGIVTGDVDGVDVVARPSARALAALVLGRLAVGEEIPADQAWPEDAPDGSGSATARLLSAREADGRWLLPALPLYLRRPDAVPA